MDRRKSLKAIAFGTLSTATFIQSCKLSSRQEEKKTSEPSPFTIDRAKEELERDKALLSGKFFTETEMATITLLADIIIPKDEKSGSASDAGVPAFIDFIVQDMPAHQTPLRGGLRWLDLQCLKRYNNNFTHCSKEEQMQMVDLIAWPEKAAPEMQQGVAFFNLMRDLTATGFYTSEIGVKDLEYAGNVPNKWNGVPDEELKRLNVSYSEWELKNCAHYDV